MHYILPTVGPRFRESRQTLSAKVMEIFFDVMALPLLSVINRKIFTAAEVRFE